MQIKKIVWLLLFGLFFVLTTVKVHAYWPYCCSDGDCGNTSYECAGGSAPTCDADRVIDAGTCSKIDVGCPQWGACYIVQPSGDCVKDCAVTCGGGNCWDYCSSGACCDCGDWNAGSCGYQAGGCGWGHRENTRSCDPGGCDEESECVYDSACVWPVQLRGQKVVEPGAQTPNPPAGFAVSLTGGGFTASNPTGNPYSFNWNSSSGATRTASVPTMAGYDTGYSVCYQENDCHSGPRTRNGSSVVVGDNSIRSACGTGSTCYGDLWWHYCPILNNAPANVQITGQSPEGNVCYSSNVTATWGAVPGAYHYQIIINDLTNNGSRVRWATGSASLEFSVTVDHRYQVSVRAQNMCRGAFTPAGVNIFQMVEAPSPRPDNITVRDMINSVAISWRDRTNDETDFLITRSGSPPPGSFPDVPPNGVQRMVVSTTGPTTGTMYNDAYLDAPPDLELGGSYQYCIFAHNSTYPAACSMSNSSSCPIVQVQDYSHAWFQVQGGDVAAGSGEFSMYLPPDNPPDGFAVPPDPRLILRGEPVTSPTPLGLPGMAFGSGWGVGNVGSSDPDRISIRNWRADISPGWGPITHGGGSGMLDKLENKFPSIRMRVVSQATSIPVAAATVNQAQLTGIIDAAVAGNKVDGVTVLEREGDITFDNGGATTALDLGSRQAILFVDGNVMINSPITLTNTGVWSVIASGNITVADGIGYARSDVFPYQENLADPTTPANLTGVYYAGLVFSTGAGELQLKIDGSIIGMGGVTLGRTSLGAYPAEFVHFNPRITKILRDVGLRRIVRQELLEP